MYTRKAGKFFVYAIIYIAFIVLDDWACGQYIYMSVHNQDHKMKN